MPKFEGVRRSLRTAMGDPCWDPWERPHKLWRGSDDEQIEFHGRPSFRLLDFARFFIGIVYIGITPTTSLDQLKEIAEKDTSESNARQSELGEADLPLRLFRRLHQAAITADDMGIFMRQKNEDAEGFGLVAVGHSDKASRLDTGAGHMHSTNLLKALAERRVSKYFEVFSNVKVVNPSLSPPSLASEREKKFRGATSSTPRNAEL
ncbi:hypothetical protein I7I51_05498 [Histoplasma capsulatum]|uniref:Uncharacterized protein n=1 Tax=Ajellomyces capsulatus TaxID=5037 RepID=A0A8A1M945_AJECA|nr:hypothetical protein I7I51_05498 [Histoplasma capsulatum]